MARMRFPRVGLSIPLLLLLLLLAVGCRAEIRNVGIKADSRPLIVFERFGFGGRGRVEISASDLSLHSTSSKETSPPDLAQMGFFLTTEADLVQVLLDAERHASDFCVLKNSQSQVRVLFLLNQVKSNYTNVFDVADTNEYGLFFANCQPHIRVSMKVRTSMYNVDANGRKNFLPFGQTELPALYSIFALGYMVVLGLWGYVCYKQKPNVHKVHVLMLVLVVLKAVNLLAEAVDLEFTKKTGTPHGWDVVFYLFSFLRGVMVFTVIILIGTGWSILKPFLQENEKKVLMIVIPLQVLANIAAIVIDETGPSTRDWITWKQLLLLVDIVCCCAVLFPIVWSIKHLRQASRSDGKAARTLVKLTLFRQFYILVVSYIYFTRIVVFALTAASDFKYRWMAACAREAATLAFYIFTGYKFRPAERNPYISLEEEEDEEEALQEALKDDDFEL
ncbi:hypothetical protein SELMODRAFT_428278 [Selaginella moellendorffii]|uniref:Intimal thickness related receptor IRP domain-containing protein n=1 Tax=Selaginella moellendorffii TaxID=88036 RepID=D8T2B5_SELML|nr:protein GPR107 [Selaginella moellendorffii]EFJ09180.1 hypothetical protein SELMODRAFT_428278 [Selaginella moellendorffii]|eukprot:XP_002989703.1 protein GPR107 [Selaginella moellendorffii]